ncbi:ORF79 [Ranid herpesvirus 1]|uniref:ORF79 n=1 Tax=Ranid herpesvirus 1 TaxID=85655 RepID=Q9YQY9_9VIRU|nr:ORF79 [Ranid herpesvirus 1]AAD12276.1 ORF79 [Ranid herpesvirus 1]
MELSSELYASKPQDRLYTALVHAVHMAMEPMCSANRLQRVLLVTFGARVLEDRCAAIHTTKPTRRTTKPVIRLLVKTYQGFLRGQPCAAYKAELKHVLRHEAAMYTHPFVWRVARLLCAALIYWPWGEEHNATDILMCECIITRCVYVCSTVPGLGVDLAQLIRPVLVTRTTKFLKLIGGISPVTIASAVGLLCIDAPHLVGRYGCIQNLLH